MTRGSPLSVSGGFLYHRRLDEAAGAHAVRLTFEQESWRWTPAVAADVVVVDSIGAWRMLPAVLRRRGGQPFVAIVHQRPGGVDGRTPWRRVKARLDLAVYRRCRALIAASATLADELVAGFGVEESRVVVIEPGCDLPAASAAPDMPRGRRVAVLSVANWYPNKGVLELLDAFAALPGGLATLHLCGRTDVDPSYAARVHARLSAPDLAGRVVVHGAVDPERVAALYGGADAFALATSVEGYATVFAEALASGLPVIGWRRPFLEHLARDGIEGRMAEPGDVPALTAALAEVVADPDRLARFAAAASRRGATLPTWERTAARCFDLLRRTCDVPGGPADDRPAGADRGGARDGTVDEPSSAPAAIRRRAAKSRARPDGGAARGR